MKLAAAIVATSALLTPLLAQAQAKAKAKATKADPEVTIEIKGFSIGMPMDNAQELYRTADLASIGGATPKYDFEPLKLEYNGGQLESLTFLFKPTGYESLRDALKTKYPKLKCETSKVSTRAGAALDQEECALSSSGARLYLRRYLGNIDTSLLTLNSQAKLLEEAERKRKAAAADL